MKDWIEIKFWELARWIIRRGYGADEIEGCKDSPEEDCACCQAAKTVKWISGHIDLIG